jgi:hypothetical protein
MKSKFSLPTRFNLSIASLTLLLITGCPNNTETPDTSESTDELEKITEENVEKKKATYRKIKNDGENKEIITRFDDIPIGDNTFDASKDEVMDKKLQMLSNQVVNQTDLFYQHDGLVHIFTCYPNSKLSEVTNSKDFFEQTESIEVACRQEIDPLQAYQDQESWRKSKDFKFQDSIGTLYTTQQGTKIHHIRERRDTEKEDEHRLYITKVFQEKKKNNNGYFYYYAGRGDAPL